MLPAIQPGDILVMHDVTLSDAEPGDVVLIAWEGRLLAHRIVAIGTPLGPRSLMTQGDAHSRPDPPVTEDRLIGRVVRVVRNRIEIPVDRVPHPPPGVTARLLRMGAAIRRVTPEPVWLLPLAHAHQILPGAPKWFRRPAPGGGR
jgi:hypothetical protein